MLPACIMEDFLQYVIVHDASEAVPMLEAAGAPARTGHERRGCRRYARENPSRRKRWRRNGGNRSRRIWSAVGAELGRWLWRSDFWSCWWQVAMCYLAWLRFLKWFLNIGEIEMFRKRLGWGGILMWNTGRKRRWWNGGQKVMKLVFRAGKVNFYRKRVWCSSGIQGFEVW